MTAEDIKTLQQHGFDDHQLTIAVQVISYFNYINRVAEGLHVDLEDWMTTDKNEWLNNKPDWQSLQY
ncbi:MAG: hypothetical protein AAFN77_10510 [Planctomycetota bacterium]